MTKHMWAVVNGEGHGGIWPRKREAKRWKESNADGTGPTDRLVRVIDVKKHADYGHLSIGTKLVILKNELAKLGLWKSVHALDEATKIYGWEASDKYTKEYKKK